MQTKIKKRHKPFGRKDIGRKLTFFREATNEEMATKAGNKTGNFSIMIMSSGTCSLRPLVKDRGVLVSVTTETKYKRVDIADYDRDDYSKVKPKYVVKMFVYRQYGFISNNTHRTASDHQIESGMNGVGLLYPKKTKLANALKRLVK